MKRVLSLLIVIILIGTGCSRGTQPASASQLMELGEKYLMDLDYEQAVIQFMKVIEIEPMSIRAYEAAAEAYLQMGDNEKAAEILRQGIAETNDGLLIRFLNQIDLAGLTVLTQQDFIIYETGERGYHRYEYDSDGYLIKTEGVSNSETGEGYEVEWWEYDEQTGRWTCYWEGGFREEDATRERGTDSYYVSIGNMFVDPYPWDTLGVEGKPERIENDDIYDEDDWIYAIYQYDNRGNVVSIICYGQNGVIGECTLTYASFQADGSLAPLT